MCVFKVLNIAVVLVGLAATSTAQNNPESAHGHVKRRLIQCMGDELQPGDELYKNEFIGPIENCVNGGPRFGLDENGWLGAWDGNGVRWHSGIKGTFLVMQRDGNLVLYRKDGDGQDRYPVWANHCFEEGTTLVKKTTDGALVKAIGEDGTLVWQITDAGLETVCNPENNQVNPQVQCRGTSLSAGDELRPNEFLCEDGQQYRFGLNARGQLNLWKGKQAMWSPPHRIEYDDGIDDHNPFLMLQMDDGNLVLYNQEPSLADIWSSGCTASDGTGLVLKLDDGNVKVEKRNGDILWTIESDGTTEGTGTRCNPASDVGGSDSIPPTAEDNNNDQMAVPEGCTDIAPNDGGFCEIQVVDFLNVRISNLKLRKRGEGRFSVTDNFDGKSCVRGNSGPWTIDVTVLSDGSLKIEDEYGSVSVGKALASRVTCEDIRVNSEYQMGDTDTRIFRKSDDFKCNVFGENLLYFMVDRVFYA